MRPPGPGLRPVDRGEIDPELEAADRRRVVLDLGLARDAGLAAGVQREELAAAELGQPVEPVAEAAIQPELRMHRVMGIEVADLAQHRRRITEGDGAERPLQKEVGPVDLRPGAPVDAVEPDPAAILQS
jgi:hypothetical protein